MDMQDFADILTSIQGWILFIIAFLLGFWVGHMIITPKNSAYHEINLMTQSPLYAPI